MNKLIFVTILIIAFLLNGCSKENLVGINRDNISKGSIKLKITKNASPSEVQQLDAFLSRHDYDTLETSLNFYNDSLSTLSFENVPVGEWHLNVNALNYEGTIIYAGETNVNIIEDQIFI